YAGYVIAAQRTVMSILFEICVSVRFPVPPHQSASIGADPQRMGIAFSKREYKTIRTDNAFRGRLFHKFKIAFVTVDYRYPAAQRANPLARLGVFVDREYGLARQYAAVIAPGEVVEYARLRIQHRYAPAVGAYPKPTVFSFVKCRHHVAGQT